MNQNSQKQNQKRRLSLSNTSNNRQSLVPAKVPRGASSGNFSNLLGDISTMSIQNDNSYQSGRSRSSLGSSTRQSLASNRQSIAGAMSGALGITGRPSIASRTSLSALDASGVPGRTSGGPSGFRTAISVPSNLRDPRNIRDKGFIIASIKLMIEFLAKTGYEKPISQKILTSPSAKDFQYIFRYLYLQLDPSYEFDKKFEDEVLLLIKQIRYPFANDISKSQLAAVGSLHTWPVLLGMLHWLVELVVCYQNTPLDALDNSPEASLFCFLLKGYQSYIDGNEDINEMKTELISRFEQAHIPICKEIEKLKKQIAEVSGDIETLENDKTALPTLQKDKNDFINDTDRFKKFIKVLENKRDKLIDMLQKDKTTEPELCEEIRVLEEEKKTLQATVDSQQICPEDVERSNSEKELLLKTIDGLNQQKEEANKQFWEREMSFQKQFDIIEKMVHDFNIFGGQIGVIPAHGIYANGVNLELVLGTPTGKAESVISPGLKDHIQPSLHTLRDHLNDQLHNIQSTLISLHEQADSQSDAIHEKKEEIKLVGERIRRYNTQYVDEKGAINADSKKRSEEMEALDNELLRIRTETSNSHLASQQLVQKTILDSDNLLTKIKEETELISHEICQTLDELLTFKSHVESNLTDLKELTGRELNEQLCKQENKGNTQQ